MLDFLALDLGKVYFMCIGLDIPAVRNESFEAKSTRKVVDIATARFKHQSTKSKELT